MIRKLGLFLLSLLLVMTMMPMNMIVKDVNAASAYYVAFNGNGATSGSMSKQTIYVGVSQPLNKNTFKKTNDTFVSWNTKQDGSGKVIKDGESVRNLTSAGNTVTLYAQWKNGSSGGSGGTTPPSGSIVVTYNGNGATSGSMSAQMLTNGAGKLNKNRYTRTNSSFLGWSTSQSATKPTYMDGEYITLKSSITLYAVWSGVSNVTVTFSPNGASGNSYTQTMSANTLTYLTANKFSRSGYAFQGWSNKADGSVIYSDGQKASFSSNVKLYAIWKKGVTNCVVTYNGNGATSGSMTAQTLTSGEGKLSKNKFVRTGYIFNGWSTVKTASKGTYSDGEYVKFGSNTTLYAIWKKNGSSTTTPTSKQTITTSFDKIALSGVGSKASINGKSSIGSGITYKSSNNTVASVDSKGKITAKKAGTATITVTAKASGKYTSVSKKVTVVVPSIRGRKAALKPWHDCLVDTFSYINGRKYSFNGPGRYWTSKGKWNGKTGSKGNTQSCITLPTVSLKRMGLMGSSGSFWFNQENSHNGGGKHEASSVVKRLKKSSKYLTITYPHKSMKSLVNSGKLQYGDVICKKGHTYVYMGTSKKDYRVFTSGSLRDIGQGTRISWGHDKKGNAKPKTAKISKQIKKSDAVLRSHSKSYFTGCKAPKDYQNGKCYIVGHIKTFTVKTMCVNGNITGSNLYMANQNVIVKYSPLSGKKLSYIEIDGKKVSGHTSSYTFSHLAGNHTIKVVYK